MTNDEDAIYKLNLSYYFLDGTNPKEKIQVLGDSVDYNKTYTFVLLYDDIINTRNNNYSSGYNLYSFDLEITFNPNYFNNVTTSDVLFLGDTQIHTHIHND